MSEQNWKVVEVASGDLEAELLKGLLEAQDIPVILSQEGIGHSIYPLTIGRLGRVEILVPLDSSQRAREVLESYHAGKLEVPDEAENEQENT